MCEGTDDDSVSVVLQWLLRVLLPIGVAIVPKTSFLWLRGELTWATMVRGPDMLNLALALSMAALIDLCAKAMPVPHRTWRKWVTCAMGVFVFLFFMSIIFRTVYAWIQSGLIPDPSTLIAMENAESAGLFLSACLVVLSVVVAVAEWRRGISYK